VFVFDHLSIYKYGSVATLAVLPLDTTINVLPVVGGLALTPVVQYI
jgi:hypothetical protein